ncbi:hypothetical protein [Rhodopirellula bahusiensis]|uniref:hypothetical protein n=1 Tax=Rhodopirellula bahusiensis TaxID=2014065 RepID=UPI003264B76E
MPIIAAPDALPCLRRFENAIAFRTADDSEFLGVRMPNTVKNTIIECTEAITQLVRDGRVVDGQCTDEFGKHRVAAFIAHPVSLATHRAGVDSKRNRAFSVGAKTIRVAPRSQVVATFDIFVVGLKCQCASARQRKVFTTPP